MTYIMMINILQYKYMMTLLQIVDLAVLPIVPVILILVSIVVIVLGDRRTIKKGAQVSSNWYLNWSLTRLILLTLIVIASIKSALSLFTYPSTWMNILGIFVIVLP